jgi:integrase
MALKGQKTTTSFIQWDVLMQLVLKLQRDKQYKFCLLISIGCFTGLRISDILSLRWEDILDKDVLSLTEKKTKKYRKIKINNDLKDIVAKCYALMKSPPMENFVLVNKYGTKPIRIQWVNEKLKRLFLEYNIKCAQASSHTLRKTFGRRVWEINNHSDKSLVLLSEIFQHSSVQITKRYLGIREEELFDVYDQLGM